MDAPLVNQKAQGLWLRQEIELEHPGDRKDSGDKTREGELA